MEQETTRPKVLSTETDKKPNSKTGQAIQGIVKINIIPVLSILMFIALFTGFQGGRYYAGNIGQELGILCSGLLFVIGAFVSLFHIDRSEWNRWVLLPVLLMAVIILLWGLVFAIRFGGNPFYNILASREFLFILLAPAIYLCGCSGMSEKTIERVVWAVFVASMLNYLLNYFRMDLREAFFSSDYRISSLVTYDEWRGFRLKPPLFAIMLGLLASIHLFFTSRKTYIRLFVLVTIALSLYIWSIVMFRSTLATMLLSILLYPLFFSRPNRIKLMILVLPLLMIAAPVAVEFLYQNFTNAEGGNVRLKSYQTALAQIPSQLFLGVGEDSAFGQTYATLYGPTFFPSDLGLVGITFKYGLLGLLIYLYFHFSIFIRLCKTNWLMIANEAVLKKSGVKQIGSNSLIWALLIFFSAQTFNLVLNPGLAYAQGITVAAISVALTGLIKRRLQS